MIDRLSLLGAWAGDEAVSPVSSSPGVKPITHVVVVYLRTAKYQFVLFPKKKYQFVFLERKTYCTSFREDRNIALTSKK